MNYTSYATWNQTKSSSPVWCVYVLPHLSRKYQGVLIFPGNSSLGFCFFSPHSSFQMILFLNMWHMENLMKVPKGCTTNCFYSKHIHYHTLGHRTWGSPARLTGLLDGLSYNIISNRNEVASRVLKEMKSLLCKALHWHWCQLTLASIDVRILSLLIQKE